MPTLCMLAICALAAPSPSTTPSQSRVEVRVEAVSPAQWTDLADAVAKFTAALRVDVDGLLGRDTVLVVTGPVGVREFSLSKSQIHHGTQLVEMPVSAWMKPSVLNSFVFQFSSHSNDAARVEVTSHVTVSVKGPPPVQLVLDPGTPLDVRLQPGSSATTWPVSAQLIGAATGQQSAAGLSAHLELTGTLSLGQNRIPLARPAKISVKADRTLNPSFFKDDMVRGELILSPSPATPAVQGRRYAIAATSEAGFKRYLAYGAGVFLIAVSMLLVGWFYHRLSRRPELTATNGLRAFDDPPQRLAARH